MAFVCDEYTVFIKEADNRFSHIDSIELRKSPTYLKLASEEDII